LFVVDAGLDAKALRERYADRAHYLIVRGRLRTYIAGDSGKERVVAAAPELDIEKIRVPQTYRTLVEPLRDRYMHDNNNPPRFTATVNFGRRFEPWIVEMRGM
jgi:hypothetical protein